MLLQLVADGTIGLDDLVVEHAPELTIADGVTIRQLLAHRSGIPEHTDGELAPAVLADPAGPGHPPTSSTSSPTSHATSRRTSSSPTRTPTTSSLGSYSKSWLA